MKCKECSEGRKFARGSVYCILYGIIIREDHECKLEGGKRHDGTDGDGEGIRESTELQKDGGGAAAALPGVLPGSGKRTGISGVEGTKGK